MLIYVRSSYFEEYFGNANVEIPKHLAEKFDNWKSIVVNDFLFKVKLTTDLMLREDQQATTFTVRPDYLDSVNMSSVHPWMT